MSKPASRLSNFRSYSYYHVLVMCDSSQTADELANTTKVDVWEHATANAAVTYNGINLGKYAPKLTGSGGRYIVLINGSTDVAYSILTAKWYSSTAAHAVPGDKGASLAVEGELTILEPKGISFLDQVVKCSVALGVDSAQTIYVLKTFFVGHTDDDQTTQITDIPPVNFITYDVTGSFTEAGGTYNMQWVGVAHGASRFPQYSNAVNALTIQAGSSLEQTFKNLQSNINTSYSKYFECVKSQMSPELSTTLRYVRYVIDVDDAYKDVNGNQVKYQVTDQPIQYKNGASCSSPGSLSFPANTSIETAISIIMSMCPQVIQDSSVGDQSTQVKYQYKVHTSIETKRVGGTAANDLECTVYYKVNRFAVPQSLTQTPTFQLLAQDLTSESSELAALRKNIIEFDYLYTGNNVDILEFDMKVNLGLAYLQTATLVNTFKSQVERSPNHMTQTAASDRDNYSSRFNSETNLQTFVFFGSHIKTPHLTNAQRPTDTIQSAYNLTKHSSLEVSDTTMKIVGNDRLLASTNVVTSPTEVMNRANSTDLVDWGYSPLYAKVNIKMPRNNDDLSLFTGQSSDSSGSTDYAEEFWFDGYYYIYGIDHEFSDGTFSQQLHMVGIPKRSAIQSTENSSTKTVESCFDSKVGCGPRGTGGGENINGSSSPSEVAKLPEPPPSDTITSRNDSGTVAHSGPITPNMVKGWNEASATVKDAILTAAREYSVDPGVMAMKAYAESNFNPSARNSASDAVGLFQIIPGTWRGIFKNKLVNGYSDVPNLQLRTDPYLNAKASAALLLDDARMTKSQLPGDVYLAHFMGGPRARLIISKDMSGRGSETVKSILGDKAYTIVRGDNPTVFKNENMTARQLRDWAWNRMAKSLLSAPTVVGTNSTRGTPLTVTQASSPSSYNSNTQSRSARDQLAAQQNCTAQSKKPNSDKTSCGDTVDSNKQQDTN